MATRLEQLKALEQRLPVANQQLASQYKAGQDIQMQQAVGGVAPGGLSKGTVAKAGAAQVAAKGEQALKGQAQTAEQVGQVQKMGLSEQASQAQQRLAGKSLSLEDKQRRLEKQLAQLTSDKRSELFDRQMKFNYTQAGDKYMNERQLSDWVRLKAQKQEDFKNYQANMNRLYERQTKVLETAYKRLTMEMQSESAMEQLKAKGINRVELERAKKALEDKLAKQKANAANKQAMWATGGMVAGGVAGAMIGGPVGAAVGAQAGGAVGSLAGSQVA